MKSFSKKYLESLTFSHEILSSFRAIGEYKGKEELFSRQSPDTLEKLLESAIIQSAESSSRIEGVTAPYKRVEGIVRANATPRNRPEQEIAGYRDVLNLIHQAHENIPLSENVVLQFHSMLYRYTPVQAGIWKNIDNRIIEIDPEGIKTLRFKPVSSLATPSSMKQLVSLFNAYQEKESYDPLVMIPLFIFDFLCIHPFIDGNGRIARLLALLLLYQAGYRVGKYISLERIIEDSKESYYESLRKSSSKWHDGEHNIFPWLDYFYGTLIAAYKEFEARVGTFKGKGSKSEQIKAAVKRFIKPFSINDIEKVCPDVSRDMIRKILRELRDADVIESSSKGRGAVWTKK